ncbi:hypothetical protein TgHK011_001088 [Trichoderma gracile]|nr:hypothetical protein TgHK011_001088 [Trichoderma gracile]
MDERGMNSTPKSLLTGSSRHSEAKGSSESSFAVSELRAPRIMPAVIVQGSSVKPHLVETKAKTNNAAPPAQCEPNQPALGDIKSTAETNATSHKIGNITFMRPRYSRRVQSRSEPVSISPASESTNRDLPPAKPTDDVTRRVSAPISQAISSGSGSGSGISNNSPAPSLIPKPGNKGLPAVRQLPIPPRNSSDGKCGIYPTPAPKASPERRLERTPTVTKVVRDATPIPATGTPTRNENQSPQKTGESRSTAAGSSRPGRSIRRMRAGAERARRGRAPQDPAAPNS